MGFDNRLPDAHGLQMIHHAASNGHVDVLKILLERGTATTIGTRTEGDHPLHLAARGGHDQAVSVLCDFGANVNIGAWKNGCYPIHYAAHCGNTNVISVLHTNRAKIDALDDQGQTALFHAVQMGYTSTVSLLCDLGASINSQGRNVVVEAAYNGHADIMSILCERGANVQIDTHTLEAPLIEAARNGHVEVVRILLEHNADVEVKSKNGCWTSLHFAAYYNHEEIVDSLLEKGADRQAVTKYGGTAWGLAQTMGHLEVCRKIGKPPQQPIPDSSGKASDSVSDSVGSIKVAVAACARKGKKDAATAQKGKKVASKKASKK